MAHTHDVYDTGKYFEINEISRFIKETSSTKLVLVQGDHKSEVITFKMPRYIDGHDMLSCNKIRVHYINIDTKTNDASADIYEVTDLALCEDSEDMLTFTWVVEAQATKYAGTLSFLIKFECTEGENIHYQWNTAKYVGTNVLAGIDNSEEFVEKYSNVLEEWYNELTKGADSIEELNQQAIAEIELAKEDAKEDIQGKADATMAEMNQFSSNAYNSFKNDVDEKAARTLESIPEDYSDMDAEVKKIAVGKGIEEDAIEPNQTTFFYKDVTYDNLYDSNASTKGIEVACDKGELSNSNAYTSDYMPVEVGESYFIGRANGTNGQDMVSVKSWAFYDENKNFMPQAVPSVAGGWNPIPEGVAFMRVSVYYGTGNTNTMVTKGTEAPTKYVSYADGRKVDAGWKDEEFKKFIQDEQLKYDAENLQLNGDRIAEHSLEPRQMTIAKVYDLNRVNPDEIQVGYNVSHLDGGILPYQYADITGYIPVQENEKIYLNCDAVMKIVFYDTNKKFVQGNELGEYRKNPMKGIVSPVTGFAVISFNTGKSINVSEYFFSNNEFFSYGETLTIYEHETKEELNLAGITVEKWNLCDRNKVILGTLSEGSFSYLGTGSGSFCAIENIPHTELTMIGGNINDIIVVEYDSEWNYIKTVTLSITEPYIFRYTPSENAVNILSSVSFVVISNDERHEYVKYIAKQDYTFDEMVKIQHFPKVMPDYFVKHLRKELLEESSNELLQAIHNSKGLKWNCLGDSLTTLSWTSNMYAIVSEKLGLIPRDYGIVSSTIADYNNDRTTGNPMCIRYADMSDDADIVTVMGCTNDAASRIGTFENMDDVTTLYGACHVLFKGLIEKYPNAKIGVILPPQNGQSNPTYVETQGGDPMMKNMSAKVAAVKEVAEFYGLPVCDLFHHGGISGYLDSSINNTLQGDYLHITTKGYQVLSKPLLAFMKDLIGN